MFMLFYAWSKLLIDFVFVELLIYHFSSQFILCLKVFGKISLISWFLLSFAGTSAKNRKNSSPGIQYHIYQESPTRHGCKSVLHSSIEAPRANSYSLLLYSIFFHIEFMVYFLISRGFVIVSLLCKQVWLLEKEWARQILPLMGQPGPVWTFCPGCTWSKSNALNTSGLYKWDRCPLY